MDALRLVVGGMLPYIAVAVFLVAMILRISRWRKLPAPAMTLFPAPQSEAATRANTLQEAVFFKSLFKGDRVLWAFAWTFHAALFLILTGHVRVFANVDPMLNGVGMGDESIDAMSSGAGGAAGVVILVAACLLLLRRVVIERVREITGAVDYLALALVGAILISGNVMRFGPEHVDLTPIRDYFATLATFGGVGEAAALENGAFLVHMTLAYVLLMTIPFTKLLHFGGIFFTHQLIRKS